MTIQKQVQDLLMEHVMKHDFGQTGMVERVSCMCGWSTTFSIRSDWTATKLLVRHQSEVIAEAINDRG